MLKGNTTASIGNLAASIGRKGTQSDITLYNHKQDDMIISLVEPSSYPDKIQSLLTSLNIADQVLLHVTKLDTYFAETLVAIDSLDMQTGYLVLENVSPDDLAPLMKDTVLSSYKALENQVVAIRTELAKLEPNNPGDTIVLIDHSFNVRGVGAVALGIVKQGTLKKYDELTINPGEKKAIVKSIQVHDIDVEQAISGTRVGLSLKNIKVEDIPRGSVLSENPLSCPTSIDLNASISKYSKKGLNPGDVIMLNSAMNYVPATVAEGCVPCGGSNRIKLTLEKPLPILPKHRIAIVDPGRELPRILGHAETD